MNNVESTVVSSRIRLARNLADYPFPNRLRDVKQAKEIVRAVSDAARKLRPFKLYYMDEISDGVAMALRDDHLISEQLAANKKYGAALIDEGDREEVGGERRHVAAVFNQRERGHFRALPRDDQHGENNGPAQKREPATLGWGDGDGLHVWLRSVGRIRCLHRIRHQRLHIVGCDAGASYPTYDLLHRFTHRTHRA